MQKAALPYFNRACRINGTAPRPSNGTQPLCEPFSWTGRRRMSDCLQEASNSSHTLCVSAAVACRELRWAGRLVWHERRPPPERAGRRRRPSLALAIS